VANKYNCHTWRHERLWNEWCDNSFKFYMPVVKALFDKFGGKAAKPGEKKFMIVSEVMEVMVTADLLTDSFGSREVGIHFNLAMMTQVDELQSERHIKMSEVEFIECLARIADKVGFREGEMLDDITSFKNDVDKNLAKRKGLLSYKLERLFHSLMINCLKDEELKLAKKKLKKTMRGEKSPEKKVVKQGSSVSPPKPTLTPNKGSRNQQSLILL
jgi:hypothetical protein